MQGLFIACSNNFCGTDINPKSQNGITKKIYWQIQTFREEGIEMDFFNPYERFNRRFYSLYRRLPMARCYSWNNKINDKKLYDFIYLRKPWFMDGDLIRFCKEVKLKNPRTKIIMEVPTYPYDEELKGFKNLVLLKKDKNWRAQIHKYVDRIVTFSQDSRIFDVETIVTSNGIICPYRNYDELCKYKSSSDIRFIACSSLAYWHGYDRAVEGMRLYVEQGKPYGNIYLDIVGDGEEFNHLKEMIKTYKLEDYIVLHGFKTGDELETLYANSLFGLDSMGRHRSGVVYNSSLKGKEYCSRGLIIVSGVATELDYDKDYKYYIRIPSDDSPVCFTDIMKFYKEKIAVLSESDVKSEIISYANKCYSYPIAMKPIIEYVKKGD